MARLNTHKKKILMLEDFDKYPVWTWDDEMENVQPLSEKQPAVEDYVDLFIKAKFKSNYIAFDGYLMGGDFFYGFVIFLKGKSFIFNINLPEFIKKELPEIFQILDCKPFEFFPIYYESDVVLKGGQKISGTLDFKI